MNRFITAVTVQKFMGEASTRASERSISSRMAPHVVVDGTLAPPRPFALRAGAAVGAELDVPVDQIDFRRLRFSRKTGYTGGMEAAMEPKLRRYRLTPDRLVTGLLAVEAFLLLSAWFLWWPFNRHPDWAVLSAAAAIGLTLLLMLLWFAAALLLRWRFQYSLRSLLLLVTVCAVACSWLAVTVQNGERRSGRQRRSAGREDGCRMSRCGWRSSCRRIPSSK